MDLCCCHLLLHHVTQHVYGSQPCLTLTYWVLLTRNGIINLFSVRQIYYQAFNNVNIGAIIILVSIRRRLMSNYQESSRSSYANIT